MMKIFIPRNVSKWIFNMSIQVWPVTISIFQLIILAIWLGIWLWMFNTLYRNGVARWMAFLLIIPIFLIFIAIAFFKYSELTLLPFIAKMIQTYFLDVTQKFQLNWKKIDPVSVALAKTRKTDHDIVIIHKKNTIDHEKIKKLDRILSSS